MHGHSYGLAPFRLLFVPADGMTGSVPKEWAFFQARTLRFDLHRLFLTTELRSVVLDTRNCFWCIRRYRQRLTALWRMGGVRHGAFGRWWGKTGKRAW